MFKNYLKIAWRNMGRHKGDTFINITGLCVAFTGALLLFLSVYYEFSFDRFHKNAENIYHLYLKTNPPSGEDVSNAMPAPLMPALKQTYPEVKYAIRSMNRGGVVSYKEKKLGEDVKLTDPDFFKMFSFHFTKGEASTSLDGLNNVVLRESFAKAIFGKEDPIGKTIQLQTGDAPKLFTVTGIAEDYPKNSTITYDAIIRFENDENYQKTGAKWDHRNHDVYVQLKDGTNAAAFEKRTAPLIAQNFTEEIDGLKKGGAHAAPDGSFVQLKLQPLTDIHTNTQIVSEGNSIGKNYLYLLLTIGILIILIACINFINLTIGRSFTRSHEIGLRKTLGAKQYELIKQFWSEAFLVCLFAFIVSIVLFYLILPYYKQLFGMNIQKQILYSPLTWLSCFIIFLFITAVAGGYPAWRMSRFNIIQILKGKISVRGSQKLRSGLIVVQFSIVILLLICTFISWQQINYLRTKPLGFNRSQVISIPVEGDVSSNTVLERMRAKLANYPNIESISGIYNNLGRGLDGSLRKSAKGFNYKDKVLHSVWMGVGYDFVKTLDIKLLAGRDFSNQLATDSNGLVINEAMAEQIGEKNIIGTLLPVDDSLKPMPVIGVVKNFNFESLHNKVEPLTLVMEKGFGINYILVKVKPGDLSQSMQLLKNIWKEVSPGNDFKGSFLDDNIERQYKSDEKLGKIFIYGAIIAIVLSCMGLLAMVLLIVTQRIKEIGIRKVLGASVFGIIRLISKEFLVLTIIAFVIAAPAAWYFMNKWLEDFAYRIHISWMIFLVAGIIAMIIAMLTISFQAIKAAMSNPVKSLRTE